MLRKLSLVGFGLVLGQEQVDMENVLSEMEKRLVLIEGLGNWKTERFQRVFGFFIIVIIKFV